MAGGRKEGTYLPPDFLGAAMLALTLAAAAALAAAEAAAICQGSQRDQEQAEHVQFSGEGSGQVQGWCSPLLGRLGSRMLQAARLVPFWLEEPGWIMPPLTKALEPCSASSSPKDCTNSW